MTAATSGINATARLRTGMWIFITSVAQAWKFLVTIISAIVLSRLLMPDDFGIIAAAAPIVGFAELIRDAGFSQVIVQRENVSREQGHAIYWTLMLLAVVIAVALFLSSTVIASFYGDRRIEDILRLAALGIVLVSATSQATAYLNRSLNFKALATIDIIQSTIGLAASIALALTLKNYWSIIIANLFAAVIGGLIACRVSGWRPGRPKFDAEVWRMIGFGAGVSFSNIMNYMSRNTDNLIIGRAFGAVQLGYYDRAYKLMLTPLTQVSWPVSRVMTPILSRLQDNPHEYRKMYIRTITLLMALLQPGFIAVTIYSKDSVHVLLGSKWSESAPVFAWLGAAAVQQLVTSTHGWLYLSQGRARDYAIVGTFGSITTIGSFFVGLPYGIVGVAAAYTISDFLLRMPFAWCYVGRRGPVTTADLLKALGPHIIACLASVGILSTMRTFLFLGPWVSVPLAIFVSFCVYFLVLWRFRSKREIMEVVGDMVKVRLRKMRSVRFK